MSTDREHDDWSRYARHLAGEASPADAQATRDWIASDAEHAREADEATSTWHALAPAVEAATARRASAGEQTDAAWATMATRMSADAPAPAARSLGTVSRPRQTSWMRRTAIGVALAVAATVAILAVPALRSRVRGASEPLGGERAYTTPPGQRATVLLADGSRADLRANTTIRVTIGAAGPRVVRLDGEAIFTVVHDSARPFRVLAGTSVTEDIGTVFAVRSYAGDPTVRVVVAEGSVMVRRAASDATDRGAIATLARGDVATLDAAGSISVTHTDDPAIYLAWSEDRIVFRGERLTVVVSELAHAYDAHVIVADSALGERRVTLDMPARSLGATLETLAALLGLEVQQAGDSLILRAP